MICKKFEKDLISFKKKLNSGLYYKTIRAIVSDNCKRSLYYKCVIAVAVSLA
jgi:hypothetical protein